MLPYTYWCKSKCVKNNSIISSISKASVTVQACKGMSSYASLPEMHKRLLEEYFVMNIEHH